MTSSAFRLPAANLTAPPAGLAGRSPSFPIFNHGPVIDGTVHGLLDFPASLVRANKHHKIPLMVGSNKNEGSIFEPMVSGLVPGADPEAISQKDVDLILDWSFTEEDQAKIKSVYNPDDYGKLSPAKYYRMVARLMRDLSFACSDRLLARTWRDAGLDAFVYTFAFDYGDLETSLPLGDFHASELPFVWRVFLDLLKPLPSAGAVQEMADIVSCQWATFAHTGAPSGRNGSQSPPNCERVHGRVSDWPRFTADEQYYSLQALRNGSGPQVGQLRANNKHPDDERPSNTACDMWETVSTPWHDKTSQVEV